MPNALIAPRRALLSVSDKTGLAELGSALAARDVELVSTGGTAEVLRKAGLTVQDVSDLTGFPELMDGRVKTLHPAVHAGLLADRNIPAHLAALDEHGLDQIDILVVNLYPFEAAVARGASAAEIIENIDIGGPAMIRAAAKNHGGVVVVTEAEDYAALLNELETNNGLTPDFRARQAARAYARTAAYDVAVSTWMADHAGDETPLRRSISATRVQSMRYGENPHQSAAFYRNDGQRPGVASAKQHQGKALSYNNINDTDAAIELVAEFDPGSGPAVAIIKHANPCGVAQASTLVEAYEAAFDCDRTSAFGGIVALNQTLDAEAAARIVKVFTEVIAAPDMTPEAAEILASKPNIRVLTTGALPNPAQVGLVWRPVSGGYLVQDRDNGQLDTSQINVVTERAPTPLEMADMLFAWRVVKHVKSNAIVYALDGRTVGIGAGQMSRVDSARIAARKAQDMSDTLGLAEPLTEGAAMASDAFFPFADGLIAAVDAGASAVIQPGGSIRDAEVVEAANAAGIAMVFTGMRHFRH
ncbi:MAG: bifunctional phosphoribosylaminoimidazolecarboxamide formyltransferase/IMP cyclohydrolase [Pseudomonadota bacterium]